MERREMLKRGAILACVTAVPEILTFNSLLMAQSSALPQLAWPETTVSLVHRNAIMPLLEKFNHDRRVSALTPDQWDELAIHHAFYHGMHSEMGHFKGIDTWIRAHESYLKTKFNGARVNEIIQDGSYALMVRGSTAIHQAANKLRLEQQSRLMPSGGHLLEAVYSLGCSNFFEDVSLLYDVIALALFIPGPGELIIMFGLMAMLMNILGQYMCR